LFSFDEARANSPFGLRRQDKRDDFAPYFALDFQSLGTALALFHDV
jgi:hypothetical protein